MQKSFYSIGFVEKSIAKGGIALKKAVFLIIGMLVAFVIYISLFFMIPSMSSVESAAKTNRPNTDNSQLDVTVVPLQHYKLNSSLLTAFEKAGIVTYGRSNPTAYLKSIVPVLPDLVLDLNSADDIADYIKNKINETDTPDEDTPVKVFDDITVGNMGKYSVLPVDKEYFVLSSGFGLRQDPFVPEKTESHNGIDISKADNEGNNIMEGKPVYASLGGTVIIADEDPVSGKVVVIDHGNDLKTFYGHLSDIGVEAGDTVQIGQPIGAVGTTGRSTGPHLHFEVQIENTPVDPLLFLFLGDIK